MRLLPCALLAGLAAVGLLAGCARPDAPEALQGPQQDGLYECLRAPQADETGPPERRTVTVRCDPATQKAVLILSGERHQVLTPMPGKTGGLYANQAYAWRANSKQGVLTDIDKVATYSCRRVGFASLPRPATIG